LKHIVFSSVAGADIAVSVDHFYSKYIIEQYIHDSRIPYTIVGPAGFMEVIPDDTIGRFFMLGAMAGVFGNATQKWIACKDIGIAVANALLNPSKFLNQTYTLCGFAGNISDVQAALDKASGSSSWRAWLPGWLVLALTPHHYNQMFRVRKTSSSSALYLYLFIINIPLVA
jgi:uncharacterized protein YbjT (DUF2867 family)